MTPITLSPHLILALVQPPDSWMYLPYIKLKLILSLTYHSQTKVKSPVRNLTFKTHMIYCRRRNRAAQNFKIPSALINNPYGALRGWTKQKPKKELIMINWLGLRRRWRHTSRNLPAFPVVTSDPGVYVSGSASLWMTTLCIYGSGFSSSQVFGNNGLPRTAGAHVGAFSH